MISLNDVIRNLDRIEKETGQRCFDIDTKTHKVYDHADSKYLCTTDELLRSFRKNLHCDFDIIYSDHASLTVIYRCKECGCVIFGGDDERYDPELCCPDCGKYKCFNEYWTKEEIDKDSKKQETIKAYEELEKYQIECEKRRHKRNGLYDNEIWIKKKYMKKYMYEIDLKCCNFFSKYHNRLKGLHLEIAIGEKEDTNDFMYTYCKRIKIPLSPYAFYLQFILKHTRKYKEAIKK